MKKKKVVVVGGGTGTYTALLGLKKYPFDLSVVVSMMDTGGSNRIIRDEFGLLPTSDIRQCMVALASDKSHEVLRNLFTYRYNSGTGITGMTFGNLFMAALTDIYSSQKIAIQKTCEILDVQGKILPVTYDNVQLIAKYDDGLQVLGEHFIDEPLPGMGGKRITELSTIPQAKGNPDALKAIKEADLIVMGPGDLYTSLICNLVVDGIGKAIGESKAKKLYVCNLTTKYSQTHKFTASGHLLEIEKYLGGGKINYVLVNKSKEFPKGIMSRYAKEKAYLVKDDLIEDKNLKVIRKDFVSDEIYIKPKSDKLARSLIRHDSIKLAKVINSIL